MISSLHGVITSQIIRHDVKIWWRHISVKNFGIALKLCRHFHSVVAIICTNFCEFSFSRSWFTEIPSFTDVVYPWHHWHLPTAYYKLHGLKNSKRERLIPLTVKFQFHIISIKTFFQRVKRGVVHLPINPKSLVKRMNPFP